MSATQVEAGSGTLPFLETRVGRFSFDAVAGAWSWDDEVFRILGLRPWSVTPRLEYLLSCKHPGDRAAVSDALTRTGVDGKPLSVSYSLAAADGVERRVLIVRAEMSGAGDSVTAVSGHYVDLTADFRQDCEEVARRAVTESARHRATIERAIGSLMVAYGINADRAFDMLRWWSQNKNVKVRDLAVRLVDAASRGATSGPAIRESFDVLLHEVSTHATPPE